MKGKLSTITFHFQFEKFAFNCANYVEFKANKYFSWTAIKAKLEYIHAYQILDSYPTLCFLASLYIDEARRRKKTNNFARSC